MDGVDQPHRFGRDGSGGGAVIPVVTIEQMRVADGAVLELLLDKNALIERAGHAVAVTALRMMGGGYGKRVVVICGKGNNGNDGRVAAARLRTRGAHVVEIDAEHTDGVFIDSRRADLVIDAAYGIGFRGTWQPPIVFDVPVLAVDIPSGLDANSGTVAGGVLVADHTVTFAAVKRGLLLNDGPTVTGEVSVADIGVDVLEHCDDVALYVVEPTDVAGWLPTRDSAAHKWMNAVRVIAGSRGMTGAASLVCAAAMRAGAGIVHASVRDAAEGEVALPTEVVHRSLPATEWSASVAADIGRFGALVIGPGLGRGDDVSALVRGVLDVAEIPTVIDGDGLIAALDPHGGNASVASRTSATVLTPHDGEFAALGGRADDIDRVGATEQLAVALNSTVLRKGPTTIVATPGAPTMLVMSGDQRLATAGSGDVLSGVIGALIARGLDAHSAAAAGAVIHGIAGRLGPVEGTIARDVVAALSDVMTQLVAAPAEVSRD